MACPYTTFGRSGKMVATRLFAFAKSFSLELVRTALHLELADGPVIADTVGDKLASSWQAYTGRSALSPSGCCS
jgi:hypothetical protein